MKRAKSSMMNMGAGIIGQSLALVVSYIARRVFLDVLNADYLGVNNLFTNILSMLSLVEIGIGPAIVYSLYKPLAEHDTAKVKVLMKLFRTAYILIGVIILVLGGGLTPFIEFFMKETPSVPHVHLIFLFFVANTAVSYFFSYRRSLIIADQRRYIDTLVHYGCYSLMNVGQIIGLYLTKNYFLYLIIQLLSTLLENVIISVKAKRMYPFLKEKTNDKLDPETKQQIVRNTSAMVFHKIGGMVVNSTDNMIISKMIGIGAVGIYANYQMVINALKSIMGQIFQAMTASIGNLGATESRDKTIRVFRSIFLMGNWLYGFSSICLFVLFNPFIELSFGADYLFDPAVVFIIVFNFYLTGMRQAVLTFRDAFGIYWQDRYKPLFESVINLVVSIGLASVWGIFGVFIGTAVSTLTTCFWVEPYILYKYAFQSPVRPYFVRYGLYTLTTAVCGALTYGVCSFLFPETTLLSFIGRIAFCLVIPNGVYLLLFGQTQEFRYLLETVKEVLHPLLQKIGKKR